MKYYAVTEDPNELFHYGVKGMKWGQHIFGDKPKSPGYKKALGKLRASVKTIAATRKANAQVKQQNKYAKAVMKQQRRTALVEGLRTLDQEKDFAKQIAKERKDSAKKEKAFEKIARNESHAEVSRAINESKQSKAAAKLEKRLPKYMQQAREGTLKYGKLSDDQIQRIQERFILENNTRRLGGTEEPSWRQQKKMARRAGYLQGITRGTAAGMEEIARAGVQYGIQNYMNRKKLDAKSEYEAERERTKNRIKNKKTHAEMREDLKNEAYEAQIREGVRAAGRHNISAYGAAKHLRDAEDRKDRRLESRNEEKEQRKFERQLEQEQRRFERNREQEETKFLDAERHYSITNARNDAENEAREQHKLERDAELAALYGIGGSNSNNGGKNNKNSGKSYSLEDLREYYRLTSNNTNKIEEARKKAEAEAAEARAKEERKREIAERIKETKRRNAEEAARKEQHYKDFMAEHEQEFLAARKREMAEKAQKREADRAAEEYRKRVAEKEARERINDATKRITGQSSSSIDISQLPFVTSSQIFDQVNQNKPRRGRNKRST